MTLGERIAALRKDKGLSQEALGELVGVSRQAVSKWESDKAVPDIQNCIAMSKALGVTLPDLLELEPEAHEEQQVAEELTEQHLVLLEKMISEYADAQKRLRRKWRWPAILIGCVLLVVTAWLWEWLMDMNRTIDYLSGELAGMQGQIISGVGDRLDESLEEERSLVTAFSAERIFADVLTNTVTFNVSVTLKEGTADTAVSFLTRYDGKTEIIPASNVGGLTYTAEVVCPITDDPEIELLVEREGITRSQCFAAECYESDYAIRLTGEVRWAALDQTGLSKGAIEPVELFCFHDQGIGLSNPLSVTALEIGVYLNDALVGQFPLDVSDGKTGSMKDWHFHCEYDIPVPWHLPQAGDTLTFALLARDNYGRETSTIISRYEVQEGGKLNSLAGERIAMDDGTYGLEEWE